MNRASARPKAFAVGAGPSRARRSPHRASRSRTRRRRAFRWCRGAPSARTSRPRRRAMAAPSAPRA
eukprot:5280298-Prymnesium_polylepis.1